MSDILEGMRAGHFYASSGLELAALLRPTGRRFELELAMTPRNFDLMRARRRGSTAPRDLSRGSRLARPRQAATCASATDSSASALEPAAVPLSTLCWARRRAVMAAISGHANRTSRDGSGRADQMARAP
jgi:hypothetical protein